MWLYRGRHWKTVNAAIPNTEEKNMAPPRTTNRRAEKRVRDPDQKRAKILAAARTEFAEHGLSGARVDKIVAEAGVNKQLLYYYFGDKDSLYSAVLESIYSDIRFGEQELKLAAMPPYDAMVRFIEYNFDFLAQNSFFVALVSDENRHQARHIKGSDALKNLHDTLRSTLGRTLERGINEKVFTRDMDAVDLYISISSLSFFYFSNKHTISAIFDRDLDTPAGQMARKKIVVDTIMAYLTTSER